MVKEQSKLIQIEEIGSAGALERIPARGKVSLAGADGAKPMRLTPDDYVGDSADRTGFGGLEAVDEVTMLAVPDLMAVYQKGTIDLEGVQAVQQAMIAHCELMGDRVAILDAPPGLNAQQVQGVARRQGRLRLEVRDAVLAVDQGPRPGQRRRACSSRRAATSPASGPATTTRAASTRRRPTRRSAARSRSSCRSPRASTTSSTRRASTASARSRAAASASGARARCRAIRRGATSTCAGSSTTSRSRSSRARSGSSSSRTT